MTEPDYLAQLVEAMAAELCEHYTLGTACQVCVINARAALTAALACDLTQPCPSCEPP